MRVYLLLLLSLTALPSLTACDELLLEDADAGLDDTETDSTGEVKPEPPAAVPPMLIAHPVLPHDTDPAIGAGLDPRWSPNRSHVVFLPAHPDGRLLVFFAGTGGAPAGYTRFLGEVASQGIRAIGLDYANPVEIKQLCAGHVTRADMGCYGKVRRDGYLGGNLSGLVPVVAADAQLNRLIKLLGWLDAQYPSEGWGAYLVAGAPDWSRITLAGHSQGGGTAAYLASQVVVARVIMFSSVVDAATFGTDAVPTPAAWLKTHCTPIERYWGLDHVGDWAHANIGVDWHALGMDKLGAPVVIESAAPPYGGTHQLFTTRTDYGTVITNPHNQIIGNSVPLVNGVPVFVGVWDLLLGN